jgi:hypothetical protein
MPAQPLESARGVILLAHNISSVDVKERMARLPKYLDRASPTIVTITSNIESTQELPVVGRRFVG